jgi:hypothetical protein
LPFARMHGTSMLSSSWIASPAISKLGVAQVVEEKLLPPPPSSNPTF